MNINENLKNEVKCKKKQLKLPLIQFDQPFHPVILYENYLIRIVMNINKTSKLRIGLVVSERVGFNPHLGCHVVSLSKTNLLRKKVLIIPRLPCLRPDMTEIEQK